MSETNWITKYGGTTDSNEKYQLLREEMKRLRDRNNDINFTSQEFLGLLQSHNEERQGNLLVFAANDFGLPLAFRPEGTPRTLQNEVRKEILQEKYKSNEELNEIRRKLLELGESVHKILVAEHRGEKILYHYPEGGEGNTNFLTVREAIGLIDYTTNSFQADTLSRTY